MSPAHCIPSLVLPAPICTSTCPKHPAGCSDRPYYLGSPFPSRTSTKISIHRRSVPSGCFLSLPAPRRLPALPQTLHLDLHLWPETTCSPPGPTALLQPQRDCAPEEAQDLRALLSPIMVPNFLCKRARPWLASFQ